MMDPDKSKPSHPHPVKTEPGSEKLPSAFGFDEDEATWLARLGSLVRDAPYGKIGPFELIAEVGRGGQGRVYRARQISTGREIAVKRLLAGALAGAETQARFRREIAAAAALDHPNIVTLYGAETIDGQPMLAMQWIDGVPIDQWARPADKPPRATEDMLRTFQLLCEAVHHAHQRGVIHRDLKPSNILVDDDGNPHVLDFGLAKLQRESELTLTHSGDFLGTPGYAAPEQFGADDGEMDVRTDIYSLGVILYQMLTGRRPFEYTSSLARQIDAIQHEEPRAPSAHNPSVKRDLDAIVLKALSKRKADRYQSADMLSADISRFLIHSPVEARAPTPLYVIAKLARRYRMQVAFAGVILLLIVAFGISAGVLAFKESAARRAAEKATSDAIAQGRIAEMRAYRASLSGAEAALQSHNLQSARRSLEQAPEHLRNWEWRYLAKAVAEDGRIIRAGSTVYGLEFSPDGERLGAALRNGNVVVWEVESLRELARARSNVGIATAFRFSPDGRWAAVCGTDKIIQLLDARTLRIVATFRGHQERVNALAFSHDGRLLVSGASDQTVRIWELPGSRGDDHASVEEMPEITVSRILQAPRLEVYGVSIDPEGKRIAANSPAGMVWFWRLDDPDDAIHEVENDQALACSIVFSPDGRTLLAPCMDGALRLWNPDSPGEPRMLYGHRTESWSAAYTPCGKQIVSGSYDRTIRLWDGLTGAPLRVFVRDGVQQSVCVSPDGALIAGGSPEGDIVISQRDSSNVLARARENGRRIQRALFIGSSTRLAVLYGKLPESGGYIEYFDLYAPEQARLLHKNETIGPSGVIYDQYAACASADGRYLAAESAAGSILLWDFGMSNADEPPAPIELMSAAPDRQSIVSRYSEFLAFSPDSRFLAAAPATRSQIDVWDTGAREITNILSGHEARVWCLATEPHNEWLASGSEDRTVRIWDWNNGVCIAVLPDHEAAVRAAAFSPDGTLLAAGSGNLVVIWNPRTAERVRALQGHSGNVLCLAFSPDGTRLASGSTDSLIRIWEVESGLELLAIHDHSYIINSLAFSADGRMLVSGSGDGTARVWHAPPLSND